MDDLQSHQAFMRMAIQEALKGMKAGVGGPFGCVIVKDGQVIGRGSNSVTSRNDPTAHAEVVAIRNACENLGHFQLTGCDLYTSCEPCPMCLGAIYWARPARVFYACTDADASAAGFDDSFIYRELKLPVEERSIPMKQLERAAGKSVFAEWINMEQKIPY